MLLNMTYPKDFHYNPLYLLEPFAASRHHSYIVSIEDSNKSCKQATATSNLKSSTALTQTTSSLIRTTAISNTKAAEKNITSKHGQSQPIPSVQITHTTGSLSQPITTNPIAVTPSNLCQLINSQTTIVAATKPSKIKPQLTLNTFNSCVHPKPVTSVHAKVVKKKSFCKKDDSMCCKHCGATYSHRSSLSRHIKSAHGEHGTSRHIQCNECNER